MSVEFEVRRVFLQAHHRRYEWRFNLGVTVLVGPGSVGKTSLLNLIKWGLGGDALLSPAVRANGQRVGLDLRVGGRHFGLVRGIRSGKGLVRVINEAGEVEQTLSADPGDDRRPTVSDFLLALLQIPSVQLPRDRRGDSGELTRVSFNDVFNYMYLDQDEIARSTIHHLEGYRDVKRMQTFEVLYRIIDSAAADLRRNLARARADRERLDLNIAAVVEFLARSGHPDGEQLDLRATQVSARRAAVERELRLLSDRSKQSETASTSRARAQLDAAEALRDSVDSELSDARRESERYVRVRAQLVQDLGRAVRAVVATPLFASHEFEECPRCAQALEREAPLGYCRLCLQEEKTARPDTAALVAEQARVEAQLRETEELLLASEARQRDLERRLVAATETARHLRGTMDEQTQRSVAPLVDDMARLSEQLGELRSDEQALGQMRRQLTELGNLRLRRVELTSDVERFEAELQTQQSESALADARVSELSGIFAEILQDRLHLRWIRDAYVDRDTYLPIVNGERLENLSSGSTKALVNTAYFLANLTYAVRGRGSLLPPFMMIDSPQVHHGAGRVDRRSGRFLYEFIVELHQSLGPEEGQQTYLGGDPFQLLIADNDVPARLRGLRTRRFSPDAPLLDDIPGLDNDELVRQLEAEDDGA